jgi:hypothetical protein
MKKINLGMIAVNTLIIIMICFMIYCIYLFVDGEIKEQKLYNEYQSFCKDKVNFCYCSYGECEFKTQWSSVNGLSNDTNELCKLANKLDDKKTLFKAGCDV